MYDGFYHYLWALTHPHLSAVYMLKIPKFVPPIQISVWTRGPWYTLPPLQLCWMSDRYLAFKVSWTFHPEAWSFPKSSFQHMATPAFGTQNLGIVVNSVSHTIHPIHWEVLSALPLKPAQSDGLSPLLWPPLLALTLHNRLSGLHFCLWPSQSFTTQHHEVFLKCKSVMSLCSGFTGGFPCRS